MNLKNFTRVFLTLGALALSACSYFNHDVVEESPPPMDRIEVIPVIQNPQTETWCPGYWAPKEGGGFAWVAGHLIPRPSFTAVWARARWVHHEYGWSFEQGHWQ